ncbi:flagellar export chaperone FliS [Synergistales bacterium]|nr:flagellar export chaperone FliS [Synergistales bacterium]
MADNRSQPQQDAQFSYQATQISTATKEQLLLITYDIGIKSCRMAEVALSKEGKQDYDLANREILRAQNVIRELMVTLNTEKGGEMATALMSLYDYMYQLLVDANIKKEVKNVTIVLTMLEELKETWEQALVKLLKEYQETHPEDEDLKAIKGIESLDLSALQANKQQPASGKPLVQPTQPTGEQKKSGGLNIAG